LIIEHIFYSTALAILLGMVYVRWQGRDPSWIIIASVFAPDTDKILRSFGITFLDEYLTLQQIPLHSVGVLVLFALAVGLVLLPFHFRFWEAALFAGIGFAAHLFEDAIVYNPAYPFFWPFSSETYSIAVIEYSKNFYGIANSTVLLVGIILVILAAAIRVAYEGKDWIWCYLPKKAVLDE
jgi:hypothetical protein